MHRFALLACLAGCSSPPPAIAVADYCAQLWRARTARQAECGCPTSDPESVVAARCMGWPGAPMLDAIARGDAHWDDLRAGRAVTAARGFECDGVEDAEPPLVGHLEDGTACSDVGDAGTVCAGGLCLRGLCFHTAAVGEACDPGTASPVVFGTCETRIRCNSTDGISGICTTLRVGEACTPSGTFRTCVDGACISNICVAPLAGGDCRTNDQCLSGACNGMHCVPQAAIGESCAAGGSMLDCVDPSSGLPCPDGCVDPYPTCYRPCAGGGRCAGGTCVALASEGETCGGNRECASGRCAGGTCLLAACP